MNIPDKLAHTRVCWDCLFPWLQRKRSLFLVHFFSYIIFVYEGMGEKRSNLFFWLRVFRVLEELSRDFNGGVGVLRLRGLGIRRGSSWELVIQDGGEWGRMFPLHDED